MTKNVELDVHYFLHYFSLSGITGVIIWIREGVRKVIMLFEDEDDHS